MAEGIESFSQARNVARVTAGLKEPGPFYNNLNTPKPMNFEEGMPATEIQKYEGGMKIKMGPIMDVWSERRTNSNLK